MRSRNVAYSLARQQVEGLSRDLERMKGEAEAYKYVSFAFIFDYPYSADNQHPIQTRFRRGHHEGAAIVRHGVTA